MREIAISSRNIDQPGVFLHEYGHYVNFRVHGGVTEEGSAFRRAFASDVRRLTGNGRRAGERRWRIRSLLDEVGYRGDPSISDLFAAVTDNRIRGDYAHPDWYFAAEGRREVEAFEQTLNQ